MRKSYTLVSIIFAALFLAACSKTGTPDKNAPASNPEGAISQSAPSMALSASCIFTVGAVELGRNGAWGRAEIGDAIEAGDTLRTGPDGSCEIQFGTMAVIKLQSSTIFVINQIILSEAASIVDASLDTGALLNKVQKLAGKDSYIIRTETSICGVRGTDFIVASDKENGTTIAVRSGRVAVVTASPVIDNLLASSSSNAVAAAAIQAIVAIAPVVSSDQELTINQASVASAEAAYKEIQAEVNAVPPEPLSAGAVAPTVAPPLITYSTPSATDVPAASVLPSGASQASVDAVVRLLKKVNGPLKSQAKVPRAVGKAMLEKLKALDKMSAMASSGDSEATAPVAMTVTEPEEAPAPVSSAPAAAPSVSAPVAPVADPAKKTAVGVSWPALKKAIAGQVVRVPSTETFVVSDADGKLVGLSDSGATLWTVQTANKAADRSYAVPFKGVVYYSGASEFLIVDAASGSVLARSALEGKRSNMFGLRIAPFPNAVVFPTKDGLEVLSEKTGETIRVIPIPGGTNMSPANYEGLAAIVNQKGVFMLVDVQSGEIKAEIETSAVQPVSQAPRIVGARACFADRAGLLVMLDLAAKSVSWEKSLADSGVIYTDVEMGPDGVFAYGKNKVFCYTLAGAEIVAPIAGVSAPPLLAKGVLYYGTSDAFLVAFQVSTRTEIGRVFLGAKMTARPLFADGFLYAGLGNGRISKVDAGKF